MRLDYKRKRIQNNYKNQLQKKAEKSNTKDILIIAIILISILLLFFLFNDRLFPLYPEKIIKIEKIN